MASAIAERKLNNFDSAIAYCQKALSYDEKDPYAHFALGLSYLHRANAGNAKTDLDPALRHLKEVVALNPDMDEAKLARQNIENIEKALR